MYLSACSISSRAEYLASLWQENQNKHTLGWQNKEAQTQRDGTVLAADPSAGVLPRTSSKHTRLAQVATAATVAVAAAAGQPSANDTRMKAFPVQLHPSLTAPEQRVHLLHIPPRHRFPPVGARQHRRGRHQLQGEVTAAGGSEWRPGSEVCTACGCHVVTVGGTSGRAAGGYSLLR